MESKLVTGIKQFGVVKLLTMFGQKTKNRLVRFVQII